MPVTPLSRAVNFTIDNLSKFLKLMPKWFGEETVTFEAYNSFMNSRHSAYQKTYYQFVGQLGLVDRNPMNVRINQYLDFSNSGQLNQYLIFWLKTYYCPNPYVKGDIPPVIIYRELLNDILNSPNNRISFNDFLVRHQINSGSDEILGNAIKTFGKPVLSIPGTDQFTIRTEDLSKAEEELLLLDSNFPIPNDHKNDAAFFERYNEQNFNTFKQLFLFNQKPITKPHNRLINGAPGTGKSHMIQEESEEYLGSNSDEYLERETFHLTYTYQQFVGTYKPVPFGNSITYEYVPGPFLRHLVKAIKSYELNGEMAANYIFIIEEINRAKNPDAVFGNIFQLLDRNNNGTSKYTVTCSEDMKRYLVSEGLEHLNKLYLPPNFYIWATMNNADQGVQAIDSAFFRRWEPEYISIDNNEHKISTLEVTINGYGPSSWNNFRKELNRRLLELGIKEDKLIGPFFMDPERLQNNFEELFTNKLLRYLFEDVLKFKRNQFFGSASYFQEVVEEYKRGSLHFVGINESNFTV